MSLPPMQHRQFPALLTRRQGVSKCFLRWTRALFGNSLRPGELASAWMEVASIQYTKEFIANERCAEAELRLSPTCRPIMSDFGDPAGYGEKAPSAAYLSRLYLDHHASVRPHLEKVIKRRPLGNMISIDVSYKAGRHVMCHKGERVVDGHLTLVTMEGEVRMQTPLCGQGHDEWEVSLDAVQQTDAILL